MVLFFLVNYVRVSHQRRRHGTTGVMLFRTRGWAHRLRDAGHVGILVVTLVQTIIYAARSEILAMMSPVTLPVATQWQVIGAMMLVGGILLMSAAQFGMGKSWRIGIEA